MIYPDGKPNSQMTDEKVQQLRDLITVQVQQVKEDMGSKYVLHPSNNKKRLKNAPNNILHTIPAFLLKQKRKTKTTV